MTVVVREQQSIATGPAPIVVIERIQFGGNARVEISRAEAVRLLDDLTELVRDWQ